MDTSTKICLLLLLLLLVPSPKRSEPNLFAQELEAKSIANVLVMLPAAEPSPNPKPAGECQCDKSTGKISYDGGTSKVDCPCNGGECGCRRTSSPPVTTVAEDVDFSKYYIIKYTAKWCGPCQTWNAREIQVIDGKKYLKKNNNVLVVEIDADKSPEILRKEKISSIPAFQICKVEGAVAFPKYKYGNVSGEFLLSKIRELDASLSVTVSDYGRYTQDELDKLVRDSYTPSTPLREAIMANNNQVWDHLVQVHGFAKNQVEDLEQWVALALHDAVHPPTVSITPWRTK